jgi:crotonobetainyl-CoA:carnitine CoA-transferase CaiB-like acyl-CoA transferase
VALENRRVTISLAHSATAALVNVAQNVLVSGDEAGRWGNGHPNLVPYQLFDAADRPLALAVGTDAQWRACALALGLHELADDPSLATNAGRVARREHVVRCLTSRLRERPAAEWMTLFSTAEVPAGLARSVREALGSVAASPVTGVAPSLPGTVRYPPPRLDEHGATVRKLGWSAFSHATRG